MKQAKSCSSISERTKTYLSNTSVHGMRYLTDEDSHWFERIFWFIICCLSFVGTYFLFVATWNTYVSNPISFVTETTYLDWNTTFPSVSICETESSEKLDAFALKTYGIDRNYNLDTFLADIIFSTQCLACTNLCGGFIPECPENLVEIVTKVMLNIFSLTSTVREKMQAPTANAIPLHNLRTYFRTPCHRLLSNCSWNDEPFECCSLFEELKTEFGTCYIINSMQTTGFNKMPKRSKKLPLTSNRLIGPGTLKFRAHESVVANIHAPEDIPFFNRPQSESWGLKWGTIFAAALQVTEIVNDPLLEEVEVKHRKCRYPTENPFDTYPYYSYSTCIIDCLIKEQIRLCGCLHHYLPHIGFANTTCDIKGLGCLTSHAEHLRKIKSSINPTDETGLECECMSSCTEPEYQIVYMEQKPNDAEIDDDYATEATLKMNALPTQRFIRNVVRTKLDLVVSMGGAAGLFLGASLLSIVEFVYYCCIRKKQNDQKLPKSRDVIKDMLATDKGNKSTFEAKERMAIPGFYPRDYLPSYNMYL